MEIKLDMKDWRFENTKDSRNIVGTYVVKNGSIVIAEQNFNGTYGGNKVLFSAELMVEIEKINTRITEEIYKNLIG